MKRVIISEGVDINITREARDLRASSLKRLPYISSEMKTKMQHQTKFSDSHILENSQRYPWMFGLLVDRYQKAFLRKSLQILHSGDMAEDVVQETFLRIYKNAHQFSERENASFSSWAYKILSNTCYSYATRENAKSKQVKIMDFADLDVSGSTDGLESKERVSFVQSVLSRIPNRLSRLLSLYFFEERSYEEIALSEKMSLSAVRSGLHRAKKQFKNLALKMI